jgi:CRISPR/Cas system-associated exonuclease Cas4 (RecB family)
MDPLTRGSLFHEIQAEFFHETERRGELPITVASIAGARSVLHEVISGAATRWHDELAPAVERVWVDEIAAIGRDLRAWLESVARDGAEWLPKYFEYGFGEVPGERDPHSRQEPIELPGGFKLKGAIDLIEEHRQTKVLRLTDHKTGRKPDRIDKVIIGGGSVLQPVLYAMTIEAALDTPVYCGRLYYCTSAGSFYAHEIPLNEHTREAGLEVLQVVDRAIERGFLAPSPTEDACGRCDFRPVCGPGMFNRVLRKPQTELADLAALRNRP